MELTLIENSPFQIKLSFESVIHNLEENVQSSNPYQAELATTFLQEIAQHPELREGITEDFQITENADLIRRLMANYFPAELTKNEIKAISLPFRNIIFNRTQRFKNIIQAAGPGFDINIRDFDEHQSYVLSCCLILNEFYHTKLDFSKPLFYDIPTAQGITKHYRILYNADFLKIYPTEKSVPLTPDDIDLLLNNYEDSSLWKKMFPQGSWLLKGFAIMTLVDATIENAVSILKEKLLRSSVEGFEKSMESLYSSIYQIPDIKIGFTLYNQEEDNFSVAAFRFPLRSFILPDYTPKAGRAILCPDAYEYLLEKEIYFAVSDTSEYVSKHPTSVLGKQLLSQNVHSFILAPLVKHHVFLGILEVVCSRPKELNSINANKLDVVMPFVTNNFQRLITEKQSQILAFIQEKYTAIHPSVNWKFKTEAKQHLFRMQIGEDIALNDIFFPDVYPLYGQVDIKGSSEARNSSLQKDLQNQLKALLALLIKINLHAGKRLFQEEINHVEKFLLELSQPLKASTEQKLANYLDSEIHYRLKLLTEPTLIPLINNYFGQTDKSTGHFHSNRRKFNGAVSEINEKMANLLDARQIEAQANFAHYYERFKTDGVEHNLYIGASISHKEDFSLKKLYELRLWQLKVLCELELAHFKLKAELPYPLEVASLLLVYNTPITICFKIDEKRFDVDGSYSARFEIVKKRIDKAYIKGTEERITEVGKITIVYSSEIEELEYNGYIQLLQASNFLESTVEKFEIGDLQGVAGLKALRVEVKHPLDKSTSFPANQSLSENMIV